MGLGEVVGVGVEGFGEVGEVGVVGGCGACEGKSRRTVNKDVKKRQVDMMS